MSIMMSMMMMLGATGSVLTLSLGVKISLITWGGMIAFHCLFILKLKMRPQTAVVAMM